MVGVMNSWKWLDVPIPRMQLNDEKLIRYLYNKPAWICILAVVIPPIEARLPLSLFLVVLTRTRGGLLAARSQGLDFLCKARYSLYHQPRMQSPRARW